MGKGWFRQWENYTALQEDPALVPCYAELLRLVYDPVAGDYRNVQGVETRVVPFRAKRGFGSDDPATKYDILARNIYQFITSQKISRQICHYLVLVHSLVRNICMGKLIQALEGVGYREGENLFGAPYDFRYAPAPPGQASRGFSRFLSKGHGRWRHLFNFPTLIFFLQNKYDPDPTLMFFLHPFNFLKVLSWFTDAIE
jgi:lysophospholipase-3